MLLCTGHTGAILRLCITPDNQLFSAARDNTLRQWPIIEVSRDVLRFGRSGVDKATPSLPHIHSDPVCTIDGLGAFEPIASVGDRISLAVVGNITVNVLQVTR